MNRQTQLDNRLGQASAVQNQLNLNPMRDRAAYMLQQRAGAMPAAFQPRDFTKGTMPGSGAATGGMGSVMNQMQTAAGQYKAGAGGMDPSALQAQLAGLKNQSQMPGMYQGQTADQMRYGAEAQQMQVDASKAKYSQDRINLQNQANRLAGTLGGGQQAPTLTMTGDAEQAERDRKKKADANRRLMAMAGLGLAAAIPGGMALGGAVNSAMAAGKAGAMMNKAAPLVTSGLNLIPGVG
jgi:hypothetical protein